MSASEVPRRRAKKMDWGASVLAWGTPEHEAWRTKDLIDCKRCGETHAKGPCGQMWTDEQLTAYQENIYTNGWNRD